jgi:D-alanyl-D-alanine carboxypeptidase/D-alanyl-D-alanine-endopeptidase (penicillin-binding protein 4)
MDALRPVGHDFPVAAARVLTALACACALAPIAAGASAPSVDVRLARALEVRGVSEATTAAMAVDLQTGAAVFAQNPDLPLEPASNEKLAITYAALHDLGPTYRFRTELLGEGHRVGNVWDGSLVLKGFGDPTLSSTDLLQLVHTLRERGIRRVTGFVIGDASWFDSRVGVAGWQPGFAGYQSPLLSALEVDGGWTGTHQARNPPLAAAARLDELLRAGGVPARAARVGTAAPSAVVLGTVYSASLADVVEYMVRYSDNFRAEMLLKEIGAEVAGVGSSAAGAAIVRRDLTEAGIPMAGVRIVDGSGLSYSDRATARELASLLVTLWHDPSMRAIVWAGLPLAGVSGTLEYRLRTGAAHERVRAKTGTTDIASALSGYVRRSLAFSVLQNGDPVNWTAARQAQDQFVQALANLG